MPLLHGFDTKLATVPVEPTDWAVATAFAANVKDSSATRQLRIAAARKGQHAYDVEYDRQLKAYASDPNLAAIDGLGFSGACHYR